MDTTFTSQLATILLSFGTDLQGGSRATTVCCPRTKLSAFTVKSFDSKLALWCKGKNVIQQVSAESQVGSQVELVARSKSLRVVAEEVLAGLEICAYDRVCVLCT